MVSRAVKLAPLIIALFILLGLLAAGFAGYIQLPMAWKALPRRTIIVTKTALRVVTLTERYPAIMTATVTAPPIRLTKTVTIPVTYTVTKLLTITTSTLVVQSTTTVHTKTIATPRTIYTQVPRQVCECTGETWRTKLTPCSMYCALKLSMNATAQLPSLPANIYKALTLLAKWLHNTVNYVSDTEALGRPLYVSLPEETLKNHIGDYEDIALLGAWILAREGFTPALYMVNATGLEKPILLTGLRLAKRFYVLTWWQPGLLLTAEDACTLILKSTGSANGTLSIYLVSPKTLTIRKVLEEQCAQLNYTAPVQPWLDKAAIHLIAELNATPFKSQILEFYADAVLSSHGSAPRIETPFPIHSLYYEVPTPWLHREAAGAFAAALSVLQEPLNNTLAWFAAKPCRVLESMPGMNPVKTPAACLSIAYIPAPAKPSPRALAEAVRLVESLLESRGLVLTPALSEYAARIPSGLVEAAITHGGTASMKLNNTILYINILYVKAGEDPVKLILSAARNLINSLPSGLKEYYLNIYSAGIGCLPVVVIVLVVR
ncbi:MAG: hypothetical protein GXO09_02440 [Crenarchaeota archaeon]|nr:hypothetical protein [Thermoproteota archaeon]